MFVSSNPIQTEQGAQLEVRSPVTGEVVGQVPRHQTEDVVAALERARVAQKAWEKLPYKERAAIFKRFHDLVLERREEIFELLQAEAGKSRRDAFVELFAVVSEARYYAYHGEEYLRAKKVRPAIPFRERAQVIYRPLGVVGIISPWNFPFILSISDAIPALLAGNAVVNKPASLTPLSALWVRDRLIEAGLPHELFQVVTGPGSQLGNALIDHADYIMFTGSTEVGRKVAERAARRLIPYSMELGGKNAMIVLADANLKHAARVALEGAFNNCGQVCISWERLYVQREIYDKFRDELVKQAGQIRLGHQPNFDVDLGSLVSEEQANKVEEHVDDALQQGAHLLSGGQRRTDLGPNFYEPTLLEKVTPSMKVYGEETFGPVLSLYPFDTVEEAISLANDSPYGLHFGVYTSNLKAGEQIAARLDAGSVSVNDTYINWAVMDAPMGGFKASGTGRRHGPEGIRKYTEPQTIITNRTPLQISSYETPLSINDTLASILSTALRLWRYIPGLR